MIELLLLALLAEIIGTIAGFGSSTIFLPLALLFADFTTALVLAAFLHLFGNLGRITFLKRGLDKRTLLFFGLPSILATIPAALLTAYVTPTGLTSVLGGFLILFSLASFTNGIKMAQSPKNMLIGGTTSGFFAGLVGTGGALRAVFLTAFRTEKIKYVATAAAIALLVDLTRIPVYIYHGYFSANYIPLTLGLLPVAFVGSFIGSKAVLRIPQKHFRKLVLAALLLAGVKLVLDAL